MESAPEIVPDLPSGRRGTIKAKSRQRSRIANGSMLLPTTDGRSIWARLMRETFESLLVHCGGAGMASETQRIIARRVGVLEAELVYLEDTFAKIRAAGGAPDDAKLDLYGRLADRQRRLADPPGWSRTPRNLPPTLDQYLASRDHEHDGD
jgi:hypothetical protein